MEENNQQEKAGRLTDFVHEELITSRKNPKIQEAAAVAVSAGKRKRLGLFLVEGARLTEDAARSGTGIFRLFYTEEARGKYGQYLKPAMDKAEERYLVEAHVAELLSSTKNSQGVFCLCRTRAEPPLSEIKGKILVLENVQDPSNLGAVLRTGEALGIDMFLLCGACSDPYASKTLRASMGAVFRAKLYTLPDCFAAAAVLREKGIALYAAVPDSTAQKVTEMHFPRSAAVFIGNEGNGLTETAKGLCECVTIPMKGRAESLNAAAAATILMWEMMKGFDA